MHRAKPRRCVRGVDTIGAAVCVTARDTIVAPLVRLRIFAQRRVGSRNARCHFADRRKRSDERAAAGVYRFAGLGATQTRNDAGAEECQLSIDIPSDGDCCDWCIYSDRGNK